MKRLFTVIAIYLACCAAANADWSATTQVDSLNIAGNGQFGTYVTLVGVAFAGCGSTTAAFLPGTSNPNYKELIAALLAAKVSQSNVRVWYTGCNGVHSVIAEVIIL